jgi:hypothetical protein
MDYNIVRIYLNFGTLYNTYGLRKIEAYICLQIDTGYICTDNPFIIHMTNCEVRYTYFKLI